MLSEFDPQNPCEKAGRGVRLQSPLEGGRGGCISGARGQTVVGSGRPSAGRERPSASSRSGGCQGGSNSEVAVVRGPTVTVPGSSWAGLLCGGRPLPPG